MIGLEIMLCHLELVSGERFQRVFVTNKSYPGYTPYIVLQIHYNNPGLVSGVYDDSGFQITYTSHLRTYGILFIITLQNTLRTTRYEFRLFVL